MRPRRSWLLGLLALFACGSLLSPAIAEAQAGLVSNRFAAQSTSVRIQNANHGLAIASTTGGTGGHRYRLDSVVPDADNSGSGLNLSSDGTATSTISFDFNRGEHGFVADFADYPLARREQYGLTSDHRALPAPLEASSALFIGGRNYSDDLFMFFKGQVGGLVPGARYAVSIGLEIATDIPAGCAGIGGAPGESVYVKAGASEVEPVPVLDESGKLRMNIDKGNQAQGGENAVVLGDVANSRRCEESWQWERKSFNSSSVPTPVTASQDGRVWLLFGVDSGFEGRTELYFTRVSLTVTRSGGNEGGGGGRSRDDHGNSAGRATRIEPGGRTAGQLNTAHDVDYFTITVPQAGIVVVETTGSTATRATVWQDGVEVARADSGGRGQNFRLAIRVAAGPVVIAVRGNGRQTGRYTLQTALVLSYLENPAPVSFQSGLGVISGWVCEGEAVTVEIEQEDGAVVEVAAAYGTERADTAGVCGDTDNGFGVLVNWNLLGDGAHAVVVLVDGIEIGRAAVTVTTLGAEFREGLQGSFLVADFPRAGEQMRVVWQESQQNFVLAPVELGATLVPLREPPAIEGVLENPTPASFQSGIGVISGWVCEAEAVVIEIDGQPIAAAAGTERGDTLDWCGDVDNGFGLLVNWAEFGAGAHEVVALVDGVELSWSSVTVTVVDAAEPFVRGLTKRVELPGFPTPEETVTLEWQESQQNFVITGVD